MANTRRKHWRKRLDQAVRLLLAAALVLQLSAGGLGMAFAADYEENGYDPNFPASTEETGDENEDLNLPEVPEELPNDENSQTENDEIWDNDNAGQNGSGIVNDESPVVAPIAEGDGDNLLTNGNFADGGTGWATRFGTWTFGETGATATLNAAGEDWSTLLEHKVMLEAGYEYRVSITLTSTAERTITADIGDKNPREFTSDKIPANEETTVGYTYKSTAAGEKTLLIYLGLAGDAFPGEHTVTIANVSIVKGEEIEGGENSGTPDPEPDPDMDTTDGAPVDEVKGNLLKNGSFADRNANWEAVTQQAQVSFNAYRTVFNLTGTAADWQQGLKQPLKLDGGKYIVTFTVETDQPRTVKVNLREDGSTTDSYTSEIIPANEPTVVSYTTDGQGRDGGAFYLFLGAAEGVTYPNKVVISNISVVAVPEPPVELPDTDNDEAPESITSIANTNPSEMTVLKDGNFAQGLAKWETWAEGWIMQYDSVSFVPVEDGGMTVQIRADVTGNNPWSIQLNQKINLKAGKNYTISFDVESDKDRAFNVVIDQLGDGFVRPIAVRAGEPRHVELNIPVQSEDALNKTFSFQLGWVSQNEKPNTNVTFKNVKIEVNGYSDKAVLITDGEFSEGLGGFTATGNVEVKDGSVTAQANGSSTLTRHITGLESGVTYTLSFMAGAVDTSAISVSLPNGENKGFTLNDDATHYTVTFTATGTEGDLVFNFGNSNSTVCLDTVRLDAVGYAEAAGVDVTQHDITRLTKNKAPLLSEMALAEFGKDVVLTYAANEAYKDAITSVKVDGTAVEYTLGDGTITLASSLFTKTSGGDRRQTYDITVSAYWYEENHAIQIVYEPGLFKATWSDEFNGTTLDTSKWGYQDGTGAEYGLDGWGNDEQQYYTRDNLTVGDGAMTITATKGTHGKPYDSARIWTQNQAGTENYFGQTYGRFEAKMKLPAGDGCQGLWPAFWLLPETTDIYGVWPLSGEIDIMEARGREGNKADGTIHFGRPWPNDGSSGSSMVWDDPLAITNYHIYSVDWTPTYMSFQVDGEEYYRAENWYSQSDDQPAKYAFPAPFDQDFYIVFNMAVGGTYDGNLNPDNSVLPAEMKVDYVRVYQFNNLPAGIVGDPDTTPETIPAGTKDYIIDPNFTDVKTVVTDDDPKNVNGWNLLTLSQFGGAADFSTVDVDGTTFAKVNITNGGSQNYSIQLTQKLALYYGNWYTLSFDAYADNSREIIAKIGGDGTNSWAAYNSVTTALGREVKHYEYTFQMLNETDTSSRLEMNMGYGTGPVYIANVKFESASGLTINHDVAKAPLESGNGIYNGGFDLGTTDRLAYWHADGGEVVKNGGTYYFQAGASGATLYQTGIELLQSDTYELDAAVSGNVTYTVTSADGSTSYASGTLTGKQTFTMPAGVTDKNATITFTLASGATLDDISLIRTTYNNVDFSGLDCYPLTNGDFEAGELGWSTYGTNWSVVEEGDGNHIGQVQGKPGNRWDAMLIQSDLHLLGGYAYELSFKAKASKAAVIDVVLEDSSYSRAFAQTNINVGTDWTDYNYNFKFTADKDLALKFLVGGGDFLLSLDDVEIKMVGAPADPGAFVANGYYKATEAVTVTHTGSADWQKAATLVLNGVELAASDYSWVDDKLTLNGDLFPTSGDYTLVASAAGYADSTVTISVYPANGDLIFNGDFDLGQEGWETYIHSESCATLDFTPGYLNAHYEHVEADDWGFIPWAIQTNQWFTAPAAGTYTLHFMASSQVERYIMVGVANVKTEKFLLNNEWKEYTLDLEIKTPGTYQLQFFTGATNPNTTTGYYDNNTPDKENFEDFGPHNFYLDHISLLPKDSEYVVDEKLPTSLKISGSTSVTVGEPVELTVEIVYPVDGEYEPTGDVTFTMDGEPVTITDGVLDLDTSVEGTYTIKAVYAGDEHFGASEAEFTVTVNKATEPVDPGPVGPENPDNPNPTNPTNPGNSGTISFPSVPNIWPGSSNTSPSTQTTPNTPDQAIDESDVPLVRTIPFTDVGVNNWYFGAVKYMYDTGIMNGISSTSFSPDGQITRAMIVTMLYRLEGEPEADAGAVSFSDVAGSAYYAKAVAWAVKNGVVNGYSNGSFGPNDLATREQTAAILFRYAAYKNYDVTARADLSGFADAEKISGYALESLSWANATGLVNGRSAVQLAPTGQTTRAEMASLLMRFCMNIAGMK